jgi:hypothetical protein
VRVPDGPGPLLVHPTPPIKVPNTVRPIKPFVAPRVLHVYITGHGDGTGGHRQVNEGKYDWFVEECMSYLETNAASLGNAVVIGVCWSQSERREQAAGKDNLCRKASKRAKGHPSWGHEDTGKIGPDGTPREDRGPKQPPGPPQPGPFKYDGDKPRQPVPAPGGK